MPIEPVKIPQNVYVEDRIVGPITLRQLIIVLLSSGFSYAIWTGIKSSTGYASLPLTVLCWIPAVIGMAFAFIKIQGISLFRLCLLLIEMTDKPAIRKWAPRRGISINFRYFAEKEVKKTPPQPHHEKIEELSALLDRGPVFASSAQTADEETPEPGETLPVDPKKIDAKPLPEQEGPIDDIVPRASEISPPESSPSSAFPLIRDILPPSHHA